jgi:hypothetical protein
MLTVVDRATHSIVNTANPSDKTKEDPEILPA